MKLPARGAWFGARAANVLRRSSQLLWVVGVTCGALLALLLLLPRGVVGVRSVVGKPLPTPVDTTLLLRQVLSSRAALGQVEREIDSLRAFAQVLVSATAMPSAAAVPNVVRDSLARRVASLSALVQRAASAPLTESYRALGQSPALRADPRVRVLLDTLLEVARERDDLGGGVTVDPVYVALTTRANELGRAIQAIAQDHLTRLRRELANSDPAPTVLIDSTPKVALDTLDVLARLRSEQRNLHAHEQRLRAARLTNAARDSAVREVRGSTQLAQFPVLVIASLTLALFLAFSMALVDEMRSPRVADVAEAERLTGLRVLAHVRPRAVPSERSRRAADKTIHDRLDPTADHYRMLAWHLTSQWPPDGTVLVVGDSPAVSAAVGANLAAVLAVEARATLLVDTDFATEPVRSLLNLPGSPGLSAVLENKRRWTELLQPVQVGRSRSMDVLPAGARARPLGPAEGQVLIGELEKASRRHDATVVVAPLAQLVRSRPCDDVIVCAIRGVTRLATLARSVAALIDAGARVRGVVLWEGRAPKPSSG